MTDDRRARFAEMVEPHVDLLYRAARRYANSPADAEDIAQEALLRAFRGVDRFDGRHPRAWLATIVRNTAISRSGRRAELVGDAYDRALTRRHDASNNPEVAVLDDTLCPLLETALDDLPASHRDVIDAVDVLGLSYQETATALSIPIGTVMSRLRRGRRRLRDTVPCNV